MWLIVIVMTDWDALLLARKLDIPPAFFERSKYALESLEEDFRPLLKELEFSEEPAVTLSEGAVLGK